MSDAPERIWISAYEIIDGTCGASLEKLASNDIEYIRADLAVRKPRGNDGAHWATCYEAHGHHDCALRRIEELEAQLAERKHEV